MTDSNEPATDIMEPDTDDTATTPAPEPVDTVKPVSFTLTANEDPNVNIGTINVDMRQVASTDMPSLLSDTDDAKLGCDIADTSVRAARAIAAFETAWENDTEPNRDDAELDYTEPVADTKPENTPDPTLLDLTMHENDWQTKLKTLGFHHVEDETSVINVPTLVENRIKTFERWSGKDCTCCVAFPITDPGTEPQPILFSFTTNAGVTKNITMEQLMTVTAIKVS